MAETDDDALREDVSRLGHLLGDTLEQLEGKSVFAHVELARRTARDRRDGVGGSQARFARLLSDLSADEATAVSRAFSSYFGLTNLAERVHRIRTRRQRSHSDDPLQETFEAVLSRLLERGLTLEGIQDVVDQAVFKPVFTAHPTEAVRRTLLTKEQRIARTLVDRSNQPAGDELAQELSLAPVRDEVGIAWQTDEHFSQPSVSDEVEHVLFYLSNVIYAALPDVHARLDNAAKRVIGPRHGLRIPDRLLRFGSWVGADMDGNPNVGADTLVATLERQRAVIVERYRLEVRELFDHLSQSTSRITASAALLARTEEALLRYPDLQPGLPTRYGDMPYRMFLWIVWYRLGLSADDRDAGYRGPQDLLADLELVAESLQGHGGTGAGRLHDLILRVRCFGFHLAALDVRQDARVHRDAVAEALHEPGFVERTPAERARRLHEVLSAPPPVTPQPGGVLAGALEVMQAIERCLRRFGEESIGLYIISMARDVDDALAVLFLARLAGLDASDTPLDVAPLFETVDDLDGAPATLDSLLSDPVYGDHLARRGGRQFVMLGYSDSNKQAGIASSRFALYQAQRALVARMQRSPQHTLTLFHGRGGTISRGGGETRNGVLAEPPGALAGRLRITEQGEIIGQKYGIRETAAHTMEVALGAIVERTVVQRLEPPEGEPWMAIAARVATASREAYQALLADEDLVAFFRHATPIDVIERLRIGSRPPSRQRGGGIEGLRAIPWVFAWAQSRHAITGWYGLGHGLAAVVGEHGLDTLRSMVRGWRFFDALLSDAEMVLAKADMGIAGLYTGLAPERLHPVHALLQREFESTRNLICEIKEQDTLLAHNPTLAHALSLRDPYVDPLHLVQVDFLRRWRASERQDTAAERVLAETVRGIARGLQNTG